jgi:WD40 repeat protein
VAVVKGGLRRERYFVRDGFTYRSGYLPFRGAVEVWTDGKLKYNFNDFDGSVLGISLSPDGRTLVTASWEQQVRTVESREKYYREAVALLKAWNTDTGEQLWMHKAFDSDLFGVAFSPDGSVVLASGKDYTAHSIKVFDARSGAQTKKMGMRWPVEMVFARDGKTLAVIDNRERILLLDTTSWSRLRTIKRDDKRLYNVAFSPDGLTILVRMSEVTKEDLVNEIGLFDANTGQLGRVIPISNEKLIAGRAGSFTKARTVQRAWMLNSLLITSLTYLWDGSIAAINRVVVFQTWDPVTLQEKINGTSKKPTTAIRFSPDGRMIAIAVDAATSVVLWDLKTDVAISLFNQTEYDDASLRELTVSVERVAGLAFGPGGKLLASASGDKTRIWDVTAGSEIWSYEERGAGINTLVLSADGKLLVTGGRKGELTVLDGSTGKLNLTLNGSGQPINAVAFSPDGQLLAAGAQDGSTRLWELASGKLKTTIQGHQGGVGAVCFSPDGKMLATSGTDHVARLWDPVTGEAIGGAFKHNSQVNSVAFSSDSRALASGCVDGSVQIWDTATGQLTRSFKAHADPVNALAYSPDGRLLATGSDDRTVKLWAVEGWRELQILRGHEISVCSLAFSPTSDTLAAGTGNDVIALWDTRTGLLKRMLRERAILPVRRAQ